MANKWFRMYSEFATDPKVQSMSETMQRRLAMLFCLQCDESLSKLTEEEIGIAMRISKSELAKTKSLFIEKGFISETFQIINWNKRQYVSDNSTKRVRKFRERSKNENETFQKQNNNVAETPPDTETDTETEVVVIAHAREENLKEIAAAIQTIKPVTKPVEHDLIADMVDNYPRDWLLKAIDIAVDQKAHSFEYVDGILANWRKAGYSDQDKPWEKESKHKKPEKAPPTSLDYVKTRLAEIQGGG